MMHGQKNINLDQNLTFPIQFQSLLYFFLNLLVFSEGEFRRKSDEATVSDRSEHDVHFFQWQVSGPFFFSVAQLSLVGQGLLIVEASRSHSGTPHLIGLLWTSDRPHSDNTQHSQQTFIHVFGGVRTHNPSRRAAADARLRPRGHWDP